MTAAEKWAARAVAAEAAAAFWEKRVHEAEAKLAAIEEALRGGPAAHVYAVALAKLTEEVGR